MSTSNPPSVSLYDQYALANSFPKEKYNTQETKEFGVHFLFAYREGATDIVLKYMDETLKQSCKSFINKPYTEHRLTALHITVIKNNEKGTAALLQRGADVNAEDAHGFTPWLHTALLADYAKIKTLLESHQARQDTAKWEQLRRSGGFVQSSPSLAKCYYLDEKKAQNLLTEDYCQSTFGMESYTDEVVFSPAQHLYLWQLFIADYPQGAMQRIFGARTSRYPQLSVQLSLDGRLQAGSQRSSGLVLRQPVEQGDFIGWYGAKVTVLKQNPKVYRWQLQGYFQQAVLHGNSKEDYYCHIDLKNRVTADAYSTGNIIRFANDGWPLMVEYRFFGPRIGVFALQSKQTGTELSWDYGVTFFNLKWGNYRLLNKTEMVKFADENPFLTLFPKITEMEIAFKATPSMTDEHFMHKSIDLEGYKARFKFIFQTPLAMIYLCLNNSIKASEVIDFLISSPAVVNFLQIQSYQPHYLWLLQTLTLLELIEKCMIDFKLDKNIEAVRNFFLNEIIDHYSVIQVIKGLVYLRFFLRDKVEKKETLESGWEIFKVDLKKKIENYSLEKDEEPPLALFKNNKIIVVKEGRADEVLYHLKALQAIDDAARNTNNTRKTYDWYETCRITIYSNFIQN